MSKMSGVEALAPARSSARGRDFSVRAFARVRAPKRTSRRFSLSLLLAYGVFVLLALWVIVPTWFTNADPFFGDTVNKFASPSTEHLFGADYLGRDVFARVVHGTRTSLFTALVAVGIGLVVGGLLGLIAGYFPRYFDFWIRIFIDSSLAIPSFLLAVVIVVSFGFATLNAAIAVGIAAIAGFARLTRAEVLTVRRLPFVESAGIIGGRPLYVLARHVFPNAYRSVLALAVLEFGAAVLAIASLAFLGYGSPATSSSDWGLLVAEGKSYIVSYPWLVYAPAAVIVVTVLALYRISRELGSVDRRRRTTSVEGGQ